MTKKRSCVKEHIGDIRAARATGLIDGMAKGFDMKGERRKKQDDEQKDMRPDDARSSQMRPDEAK